jgi:multicomponent Na+:H+ antiporter subunit G
MSEYIAATLIMIGSLFVFISAIGLLKMPDIYMRMSATTKAATLGVGAVLLGTAFFFADLGVASRAGIIILFLLLTAPVAAHMIGRASYFDGVPLWDKTIVNELKGKYNDQHTLSSQVIQANIDIANEKVESLKSANAKADKENKDNLQQIN